MEMSKYVYFTVGLYVSLLFGTIYTPRFGFLLAIGLALVREYEDQVLYGIYGWKNTLTVWAGAFVGLVTTTILYIFLLARTP